MRRMSPISKAVPRLVRGQVLTEREAVVLMNDGRSDFGALMTKPRRGRSLARGLRPVALDEEDPLPSAPGRSIVRRSVFFKC
jgi:hypothetical protein